MNTDNPYEIKRKLIDIEKVFADKNPKLLRLIPRFVFSYLKRIIHQEAVNDYIWKHRDKIGLPFVEAILSEFGVKVQIKDGRQNLSGDPGQPPPLIPPTGRYIVVANHPLGGLDGMALMQELGRARNDIIFPVNDLLLYVPGLRPLFIPINKHGKNTENARLIDETFASEKMIPFFPAGLVSRKQPVKSILAEGRRHLAMNGEIHDGQRPILAPEHKVTIPRTSIISKRYAIRDLDWKNTFIKKARKYQRDVIPVYVDGRNSNWFYNLSFWRKRLGIGANIEMLYLVDEMTRQFGKTITLVVGDPIPWTTFRKPSTDQEWAGWVKEMVYRLGR